MYFLSWWTLKLCCHGLIIYLKLPPFWRRYVGNKVPLLYFISDYLDLWWYVLIYVRQILLLLFEWICQGVKLLNHVSWNYLKSLGCRPIQFISIVGKIFVKESLLMYVRKHTFKSFVSCVNLWLFPKWEQKWGKLTFSKSTLVLF